jgi:zinc protease
MIQYEHFVLENGLEVFVHTDLSNPMVAFNICYNVGSRDEDENKTGFAHLFEHLMFGGSKNIPNYDGPLQMVGAENNAFTSPDITNYYITLPANNIETAFWLESDRMLNLSFDPKVLEVQRKVVIEEFKQRYLNQPYGDVWLKLRPLAYTNHPYKWATIGKEISHIDNASMDDVKAFFYKHYLPNNATLVIGGGINTEKVKELCEKWFSGIPKGEIKKRDLPIEPKQNEPRFLETSAKVPLDSIYKTYHMPGRYQAGFHTCDLISDILGRGKSSRLYSSLVLDKKMFNSISAYVTSSLDPGLLVISGTLNKGENIELANEAINQIVEDLKTNILDDLELEKVKNQAISTHAFGEVELLNRVMNLAFAANAGDASRCNTDIEEINKISKNDILQYAKEILDSNNTSTMFYRSNI